MDSGGYLRIPWHLCAVPFRNVRLSTLRCGRCGGDADGQCLNLLDHSGAHFPQGCHHRECYRRRRTGYRWDLCDLRRRPAAGLHPARCCARLLFRRHGPPRPGGAGSDGAETAEPALEEEALDPLALLKQPAQEASKAQLPQDAAIKSARVATSRDFAAALAALGKGEASVENTEEATLDLPLESLAKEALESLKDSAQPTRPDQFVSKLNALTQALNHQVGAAQRLPLVPGQPVAMQQGGWSEAVVDKVMWLSSQNLKSAEIQLDPAELGRLEVRVDISKDQTQVTFASPNAGVREALEGQMHRLRELFAQQGMNLADANVSDQSLNRGWQGQGEGGRGGSGSRDGLLASDELQPGVHQEVRSEHVTTGRGLVDYYA